MKKVKVVQIGTSHDHATATFDTLLHMQDIFELVGVVVTEGEAEHYKNNLNLYGQRPRLTLEETFAIPDLDAAVIETYDMDLAKYAQMAAEHGLNIQMDKPGGQSVSDYEKLIDTCKEKNLIFHTGYMYRYNPAVMEAIEKATSGALGEIFSVEAHMDCLHGAEKRTWLSPFAGGMLYFLGSHLIDLIYRIQGEPNEIIPLNCSTGFDGVDALDYGMVAYKYPHGISFAKTTACEVGGFLRRQLVICGSKGTIELKPLEHYDEKLEKLYTTVSESEKDRHIGWHTPADTKTVGPVQRYEAMLAAFATYVRGVKENPYTYEYERKLFRLLAKSCGF